MTDLKISKKVFSLKKVMAIVMAFCVAMSPIGNLGVVHANEGGQLQNAQTEDQTGDQTVKVPSTKVVLNKTKATIKKGKKVSLKTTLTPMDSTDSVVWTTSNKKIATVTSKGIVKGVKNGKATITATATSGVKATCKITVKEVASKSIRLNKTKATVVKGKKITLKAIVKPKNSTDNVIWKTSNKKVVTVKDGVVLGVNSGKATIKAKVGNKTVKCQVTVKTVKAKSVKLNNSKVTLYEGENVTLKGTISPKKVSDKKVWTTSDEKVATVKNGVVTAVGKGKATITIKIGKKTAKCKVTVKVAVPSTEITLNKTTATISKGKKVTLKATVVPSETSDKVTWKTSNKKVATVNSKGVVKGIKKGTVTITAKTTSGLKVSCTVTVKK